MAAVDPGRAVLALAVACLVARCTSDHHFIDPAIFYGHDAGGVIVAPPAGMEPEAGSVGGAGSAARDAGTLVLPGAEAGAPANVDESDSGEEHDGGCADGDDDGTCDDLDRCPAIAGQDDAADIDADGVPDACDPCGPAVALRLSPSFYFAFDEETGSSSALNAGSANPSASYLGGASPRAPGVTLPARSALHLSGANNTNYPRVTVQGVTSFPSGALTLSLWLRTSQPGDFTVLSYAVGNDPNHFSISFVGGGPLRIGIESTSIDSATGVTSALADGAWHHVVITGGIASALRYYRDGQLVTSVPMPAAAALDPGGVLIIGQDQDALNGGFDVAQALEGDMDELALYDRELSEAELQDIFTATTCE